MMNDTVLEMSEKELVTSGAIDTATEINQQPEVWAKVYDLVRQKKNELTDFLQKIYALPNLNVVFTGAGTSAFVGTCLEGIFQKNASVNARAIATTQIVTHPEHYFSKDSPTLLVSFARSGDSPESVAVVELADQICTPIYHLVITCNSDGKLARYADRSNAFLILLPPETNDKSLAMTSSYTSMLLAGILVSKLAIIDTLKNDVALLAAYGEKIISDYAAALRAACEQSFDRSVFLGSGPMIGCAQECHLKLQELTAGVVIAKFDSLLGFRHGPKAVITNKTLMVYFFDNHAYAQKYELDLLNAVNSGERGLFGIGVMEQDFEDAELDLKIILAAEDQQQFMDSDFLVVCNTLVGQLLGFYKSLQLGLAPDAPSASGAITRVVQGVTIYPYTEME